MELFAVSRYEDETTQHDPDKERRILQRMQKKIERKRLEKVENDERVKLAAATAEPANVAAPEVPKIEHESMAVDEPLPPDNGTASSLSVGSDFMLLGDNDFQKLRKVDTMLPSWLAYPTIISRNLSENTIPIQDLDYISSEMKECLSSMNIDRLFPVQEAVIPWILNVHAKPTPFRPRDICVSAPTGSGKTLAYALPIVQHLSQIRVDRRIRALVVLPVNELAIQVLKVFQKLCQRTHLKCSLLSKFTPFAIEQTQLIDYFDGLPYSKVDIVVATTGRLVEHIHATKGFCLKSLRFLVMDEADRIMEQIQNNWLYHLDEHVKEQSDSFISGRVIPLCFSELCNAATRQPHKLLFSATLSQDPEKLQSLRLFEPKLFTSIVTPLQTSDNQENAQAASNLELRGEFIGKYTTPAELTEKYCITEAKIKPLTLYSLLTENSWNRFLCFANSGESAHRLSYVLQTLLGADMKIEELSSGLSSAIRNSVLLKFQTGKINGIICSDALARGIDFPDVDVVISYDAPRHVKTYIHRIGRVARAGRPGVAVTILTCNELNAFQSIVKKGAKEDVEEIKVSENAEELRAKDYATALERMQNALKREKQIKLLKEMSEKNKINPGKRSHIGQLQSQVQRTDFNEVESSFNVPESWKWENQANVNDRKERKGKSKKRKSKNANDSIVKSNVAE